MTDATVSAVFSDEEEEDVIEDEEEDMRLEESIRKDLICEFAEATPMKLTRESISHNREPMKCFLRVRPFTNVEVEEGESQECMNQENPTTLLMRAPKNSFAFKSSQRGFGEMSHKFTFSRIFNEDTSQKTFFDDTMLGTVKDFIDGQNCLVFTYGVTNAGKTYTIQGVPQDGGILPRSLDVIFNSIENRQFPGLRLKPRYFCDVIKLSEKQLRREEDVKTSVLALGSTPPVPVADQTTILEGESMTDDSLNSETSRASYSTANDNSQDSSKLNATKEMDVMGIANQVFYDEINARIPDDTVVNVDAQGPIKFSIWVSFAEIYNEYMYDLLEPLPKTKKVRRQVLKLAEDKNGSIYIKGLKQIQVNSADEAYRILKIGQRNLSIAATKLNHCSSRSHCIFSVKILRVVDVEDPHVARVSHLSFCDLAGSERYTRTQNTGDRLKEAGNINTSLLTLGKCIHALRYNQNHPKAHPKIIPFRESKLTRLFQSFFLGKGKASMIVNVNQCASGFDETMHVLKFSAIAKQVTTVTSKLDNRWKEPPKKASRPSRSVSLALNRALDARVKGQRPSVPWATPGTIAQVMKETGHGPAIEDTVFEVDEEEEEEDDETEEEEEEAETPVAKQNETASKIQSELLAVIEVLKQKLVDEKAEKFHLETKIRDEVCAEMAQQLVEIEQDYNDRFEEDKQRAEEVFEKRLEIYAKSVQKTRKRARPDEDTSNAEEQVSVTFLAAEQNKVRDREEQIDKLTSELQSTEQSLKEFEDRMHDEMQTKEDQFKTKLAEMAKRMSDMSQEIQDVEALKMQLANAQEKLEATQREKEDLCSKVEQQEVQMQTNADQTKTEAAEITKKMSDMSQEIQDMEALKKQLASAQEQLEAIQREKEELNRTVEQQEVQMQTKEDQIKTEAAEITKKLNEMSQQIQDMEALKNQLASAQEQVEATQREKEDLSSKVELQEVQKAADKTGQSKMFEEMMSKLEEAKRSAREKEDMVKQLEDEMTSVKANATSSAENYKEQIEELRSTISSHSEKLSVSEQNFAAKEEEVNAMNDQLTKEIHDLQSTLSSQKEKLLSNEQSFATREEELNTLNDNLRKQIAELKSTISMLSSSEQSHANKEEGLEATNVQLTAQIKELNQQITDQARKLESSKEGVKAQEKEFEASNGHLQKQAEELQKTNDDLSQRLENNEKAAEKKQEELQGINADLRTQVEDLTKKVADLTQRQESSEKDAATKQEELEALNERLHEQLDDLKTVVDVQTSQLKNKAKGDEAKRKCLELTKQIKELEAEIRTQREELKENLEGSETLENKIVELTKQLSQDQQEHASQVHDLEGQVSSLKGMDKQVAEAQKEIQERDSQIEDLYSQLEETKTKITEMEKTMATQLCAEIKSHEEAQHEMRTTMLEHTENETEAKHLIQEQEAALEELKVVVTDQQNQIEKLEGAVSEKSDELKQLEVQLVAANEKAHMEETTTQTESGETSSSSKYTASSSEESSDQRTTKKTMSTLTSTTSLSSTVSTTSNEDDDSVIIIEPEDQEGYKAGRLSRVEIDATPLQKKNSRKGRSTRATKTSTRAAKKRGGDDNDAEGVSSKRKTRRVTRAASKTSINEEIENQPEDGKSPSTASTHGSSQRRGPLSRINEYLQNSPIGKSVYDTAKRLVETATGGANGGASPTPEEQPPTPPRAVEMDTFVPSLVPEGRRRKRKLYKTDISAPFECSPYEIVNLGEAKPAEGSGAVISRKLRSRSKKNY